MKKIITIMIATIVAMVSFTINANAQISFSKEENPLKMIKTVDLYWDWIYSDNNGYYFAVKSSNQFDEHYYWLPIGATKDECVQSFEALIDLCENINEDDTYYMYDMDKIGLSICKGKGLLGERMLLVNDTKHRYAGYGTLSLPTLKRALNWCQLNL